MVRRILTAAGYTVLTASDGGEALQACALHPAEIHGVVTDVIMPDMNGRQLAAGIAGKYPNVAVLYMSGYADDVIVHHEILDAGTCFIAKPFEAADLQRKVRELLDKQG